MKKLILSIVCLLTLVTVATAQSGPSNESRVGGGFVASQYNYGGTSFLAAGRVLSGPSASGSGTITLYSGTVQLADGRAIVPYNTNAPITVGIGANAETVTPSAVSGCVLNGALGSCQITATFSNVHGAGDFVSSGTFGLQEAINDANAAGGGTVVVDSTFLGSTSTITSIVSTTPKVWVADTRSGPTTWFGKSGTGAAAYSASNNDIVFTVTLSAGAGTKTLSQTYTVAPICQGTDQTAANAVKAAPTTSTVALAGTTTDVVAGHCDLVK